jgi:hypothetical protein
MNPRAARMSNLDRAPMPTRTLYRPVGSAELSQIAARGYRRFPPRLSDQAYFYPVRTRAYAEQIARDWNARGSGPGYVARFEVSAEFLDGYQVRVVGARIHEEYWIPAECLEDFNDAIVGRIEIVAEFRNAESASA